MCRRPSTTFVAIISNPSTDPLGETVSYRYEWVVDDETSGLTDATVPAARTSKGERWMVRVTPSAGERVGTPGEASVTISNTPRIVPSVGASTYRPRADDLLRAYPARPIDPDGDTTSYVYRWSRNDETVSGAGTDTIDLSTFASGDTVSVEVLANDGDVDGPPTRLGPLEVDPAVTGWVPRLPNRVTDFEALWFLTYDSANQRVLWATRDELWELALETDRPRWARL
jgi:hypothetical protein